MKSSGLFSILSFVCNNFPGVIMILTWPSAVHHGRSTGSVLDVLVPLLCLALLTFILLLSLFLFGLFDKDNPYPVHSSTFMWSTLRVVTVILKSSIF